jgi:hypothetical protein
LPSGFQERTSGCERQSNRNGSGGAGKVPGESSGAQTGGSSPARLSHFWLV